MPKPLIFVIIVMLIVLPRSSSSSSMIVIISTIIMFARRWRRQHSISDLLKEPVAQEAIQVQFCFFEHCYPANTYRPYLQLHDHHHLVGRQFRSNSHYPRSTSPHPFSAVNFLQIKHAIFIIVHKAKPFPIS